MYCTNCGKENPQGARFCQNCGIDMTGQTPAKPVSVMITEKRFDLSQISAITAFYVILISVLSLIGSPFVGIIIIIISYFLSVYAIEHMTYKINGSVNWAFAIIMSFGIIGYVCYWIWFLTQRHRIIQT
jgi:hypothetical protein